MYHFSLRLFYKDRANDVDVDLPSTVANKILAEG